MSQLNGAYYGPAIPPQKSYNRPGRGSGVGCCCGCLFSCLFSLIFKVILTLIIIVAIAVFIFWLIVRPNMVKFHVTDATLTEFNYTNNTLHYDLALNITVRNPNKRLGIYYDFIEANALFHDARFNTQYPDPFYQGHKTTHVLNPVFKGDKVLVLDADQSSELKKENSTGLYEIDVKMYLRVRFKLGAFKTKTLKPKVSCDLRVPFKGSATAFETIKCDWDR
ncbi:hypothetical protein LR48_Vigan03g247900 [Vigna angularis]|uniref:NDR1/HIN1-like protein n=2 Tax=Phaseolus angularis TaxID=3914 RepID=A0A0L9U913_PHAAN|nr:NDR1/HIN1-like protein 10 [Vigna angularis]KAG2406245.1 NDR1/HIN1-like protein [Vigna angularis]KOM39097.1 hypothetical protein LR48_Vigan03g247900 [Vigna angularis]BAT85918.1 hypothetical protein VIGAN_04351800 [Vigna angularis var. angularis]